MSMLEYLAEVALHGHTPQQIGQVTIGRTVYTAGQYLTAERDAPIGSPREGQRIPPEKRIALMPQYRKDWVTSTSAGPTPPLLPPSWKRNRSTVYVYTETQEHTLHAWYVGGYNPGDGILWLHPIALLALEPDREQVEIDVRWAESFQTAIKRANR